MSFWRTFAVVVSLAGAALSVQADFYVAPNGDDGNAGTREAPFATIARAQEAVRAMVKAGLKEDVKVVVRGGAYLLDEPLVFGPEDGGSSKRSVTYAAEAGESVILSGGRPITGWKKGEGGKWTAEVSEAKGGAWAFRDLYVDGKRLPRGRYPNGTGLLRVESVNPEVTVITLKEDLPFGDLAGKNAELVAFQNWSISRVAIEKIEGKTIYVKNPMGWIGHGPMTTTSPGKPCYIEHAPELADAPGEWYLDQDAGVLTYVAAEGEDPNARTFVAPKAACLVMVSGSGGTAVQNLHFVGLSFEHGAWSLPPFGYMGIQAGHYGTSMPEPPYVLPHAIEFTQAVGCSVRDCTMAHTGASGIGVGAGCRENVVEGCELFDIGGNGIVVGRRSVPGSDGMILGKELASDWPDAADVPQGNVVANNTLHECAAVNHGCVGIFDAFCDGTQIKNNYVHHMPYTGISVGFRWNESETSQRNALIGFNKVHDTMMMLADGGCLYTLGYQPGTVIRGNLLFNVHRSEYAHGGAPNNGIFFDQGSKGYLVEGNIIYNTSGKPIRFNQTNEGNMTWKDNYFGVSPENAAFPKEVAGKAGPVD